MINLKIFKFASVAIFLSALVLMTGCGNNPSSSSSLSSSSHTSSSSSSSASSSESESSSSLADVPVTSISVGAAGGATVLSVIHGTLQMSVSVQPADATDKSVVWSVVNGTGEATISVSGLLTAVANGDVLAKATSVSAPSIFGTRTITIINQAAETKEALISAIASANLNKDTVVVSVDGSDVMPANRWIVASGLATYVDAITAAQLVVDNALATQTQVDSAIITLASATSAFNDAKAFGTKVIERIMLGTSANYAILSKAGITAGSGSVITGDVAVSPVAGSYMTGFGLTVDSSGEFAKSALVDGSLYAADYVAPTPATLTTAVYDMEAAYNTGMEVVPPDYAELYSGDLSGHTFTNGFYKFSNNVLINTDITLSGSASDVWIFQISGTLTQAVGAHILLVGGAIADNIFWVVADAVTIAGGAHFEGIILAQTSIAVGVNSSVNGRLLAQTAVTLGADATVFSTVIPATEINVQAAGQASTITVSGGTLQMSAVVLPEDASNKSVIWSVTNGTGSASISGSGLLTAIADGDVTVTATSANSGLVYGIKVITISNQPAGSKTALTDAVAAANLNKVTVSVSVDGTDILPTEQWVTALVLSTYTSAIGAAQAVIDDALATQGQVDSAVTTLGLATSAFNDAKAFGSFVAAMQTIDLGLAGDFVALAKAGISTTGASVITGNLGVSPAAASFITGFDLSADSSNTFSTSTYVTGHLFAADYAEPTPGYLTTAVSNMEAAYSYGMGLAPDTTELYAGDLSGQNLAGGVYKFSNDVVIYTDLTLTGSATDSWIFQISGKLTEAENIHVVLAGGALAKNIFWIVADTVAIGVGASFEGNVLAQVDISMGTGSSVTGRLLAQTAVTLDATTIVAVAPPVNVASELFISEYIEGSATNKALELYNGTKAAVDLSVYSLALYANGSATATATYALTGTLPRNQTFVFYNTAISDTAMLAAIAAIPAAYKVGRTYPALDNITNYNGDDAVALLKNGVIIDLIGVFGIDPGTEWTGAAASGTGSTLNTTLSRVSSVILPKIAFAWLEWAATAQDTSSLGVYQYTI